MQIYEEATARIAMLGYTVTAKDRPLIEYFINSAEAEALRRTNQSVIPDELHSIYIDMIAGSFLQLKRATGASLNAPELPIKSITEGDISITYANTPSTMTFDETLSIMASPSDEVFVPFRRLKW